MLPPSTRADWPVPCTGGLGNWIRDESVSQGLGHGGSRLVDDVIVLCVRAEMKAN